MVVWWWPHFRTDQMTRSASGTARCAPRAYIRCPVRCCFLSYIYHPRPGADRRQGQAGRQREGKWRGCGVVTTAWWIWCLALLYASARPVAFVTKPLLSRDRPPVTPLHQPVRSQTPAYQQPMLYACGHRDTSHDTAVERVLLRLPEWKLMRRERVEGTYVSVQYVLLTAVLCAVWHPPIFTSAVSIYPDAACRTGFCALTWTDRLTHERSCVSL